MIVVLAEYADHRTACAVLVKSAMRISMTVSQLVFFIGWLVVALAGGALLIFVWERLLARSRRPDRPVS